MVEVAVPKTRSGQFSANASAATSLFLSFSLVIVAVFGFWAIFTRYLNVSGDEVHFYYLSLDWLVADYQPYWSSALDQMRQLKNEGLTSTKPHLETAILFLSVQPDFFLEYKLPRLIWSIVNILVVGQPMQPTDLAELPTYAGITIFYMFTACAALSVLTMVVVTARENIVTKLSLVILISIVVLKEVDPWLSSSNLEGLPSWARGMINGFFWTNKDLLLFSFSGRSNLLWFMLLLLAFRWSSRQSGEGSSSRYYVLLPIISLIHSSEGTLIAAMLLLTDAASRPGNLFNWRIAGCYSITFLLGLSGGFGNSPLTMALLLTGGLLLFGLAAASFAGERGRYLTFHAVRVRLAQWPRFRWLPVSIAVDGLLFTAAGILLVFAFVSLSRYAPAESTSSLQQGAIAQRLGAILAVTVPATIVFAGVNWILPRLRSQNAIAGVVSAVCVTIVATYVFISIPLASPSAIRARLVSHMQSAEEGSKQPLTFAENNELHRIWWIIAKSAIARRQIPMELAK